MDVDDEIALLEHTTGSVTTAIAIDVSDGRKLWDVPDLSPRGISDAFVLAQTPVQARDARNRDDSIPDGTVVALDAKTGKRRWDLTDRYSRSAVVLVAGSATVVQVPGRAKGSAIPRTLVIETKSGHTLAELNGADPRCHSDRKTLIACEGDLAHAYRLVTYHVGDGRAGISAHEAPDQFIGSVWGGRVFTTSTEAFAVRCRDFV